MLQVVSENAIVTELLEGLYHKDPKVRLACVRALGELHESRAIPYLIQIMQRDVAAVREAAAKALGDIGDPAALTGLQVAYDNDFDRDVRHSAAVSIRRICPPETPDFPIEPPEEQTQSNEAQMDTTKPHKRNFGIILAALRERIRMWVNGFS